MEYKYLLKNQNIHRYDLNNSKYKKILDNLLSIKHSDKAINFQINKNNIDLVSKLDEKSLEKIYNSSSFSIKISNFDNFDELDQIDSNTNLYNYIINNSLSIPKKIINNIVKNKEELKINKAEVINYLTKNSGNFLVFWKQFKKMIDDDNEQNNIWPLYIGTYFLDAIINDKHIFAPLIYKNVNIVIKDNNVYLESTDNSVILNEKIIYYIENFKNINFAVVNPEIENISFSEIEIELDNFLENSININSCVQFQRINQIISEHNLNINKYSKCLVLSNCNPTGSFLRNVMIDLIEEDKIDDLLNVNIDDVFNSDNNAIENLFKQSKIYRICPTDLSQEKAINAALNTKYSIIIGPPGTGKSQTIANLLCNILAKNKTALFISQKKVALEVVLERLNKLRLFTLSLVNNSTSNAQEKQEFYKYLNELFDLIKYDNVENINQQSQIEKISNKQINYWAQKDWFYENYKDDLEIYYEIINEINNLNIIINLIKIINIGLSVKTSVYLEKMWDIFINDDIELAKYLNEEYKKSIFTKKPKFSDDFLVVIKFNQLLNNFKNLNPDFPKKVYKMLLNLNLDKFLKFIENYNFELVPKCNEFKTSENEIIAMKSSSIFKILQEIQSNDKKFSSKFFGRIQRSFTLPYKFINLFKNELKKIFNIVVSTPEALSTFVDFKNETYDYVIFDEASQIFLEKALPYISVGNKIIIAGDNQQMQPTNWLGIRAEVDNKEDNEDENIDSLLTYAIAKGVPMYNLELNYRSVHASLTSFSSKEFYNSNLKCLNACNVKSDDAIEVINVNGIWKDKINFEEAEEMIRLLQELHNNYNKIILLTLNLSQMQIVDYLLSTNFPELYHKVLNRQIIIKNLENIQGDEGDLVIMSIAYTKDAHLHSTYVCRPEGRNALNVAITRAKEKFIVLKSIKSTDVVPTENNQSLLTFKNWLEFLELPEHEKVNYSSIVEDLKFDSGFESDVYTWLNKFDFMNNYNIKTQHKVGSYRIDLAICDKNTDKYLLGIEVDGWKYHSSPSKKYHDIVRQDFLESKGYKILRIPEIVWKIDKPKILNSIKSILLS